MARCMCVCERESSKFENAFLYSNYLQTNHLSVKVLQRNVFSCLFSYSIKERVQIQFLKHTVIDDKF